MNWLYMVLPASLALCCLTANAAFAAATPDDAKVLAEKAAVFLKKNGREKAFAAFNDPKGEFVKGDLYIFVVDFQGDALARGANPELIGTNIMEIKDVDGVFFIKAMIAQAKEGPGWVTYKWKNPVTNKVESKKSYIIKADGMDAFIGCGAYE